MDHCPFSLSSVSVDVWIIVVDKTVLVTLSQSDARTWGYWFIVCLFDLCIQCSFSHHYKEK